MGLLACQPEPETPFFLLRRRREGPRHAAITVEEEEEEEEEGGKRKKSNNDPLGFLRAPATKRVAGSAWLCCAGERGVRNGYPFLPSFLLLLLLFQLVQ